MLEQIAEKYGRRKLKAFNRWAMRDGLRGMRTEAVRSVKWKKRFRHGLVLKHIAGTALEDGARLHVKGEPIPLAKYPGARFTKKGLKVKLTAEKSTLFRGAFKARMSSGHVGAFMRDTSKSGRRAAESKSGKVWRGKGMLPIKELWGPGISSGLKSALQKRSVLQRGAQQYTQTLARLYLHGGKIKVPPEKKRGKSKG
jgi:hypothetical protein